MKAKELIEHINSALKELGLEDADILAQPCWEAGLCSRGLPIYDVGISTQDENLCIGFDGYAIRTDQFTLDLLVRLNKEDNLKYIKQNYPLYAHDNFPCSMCKKDSPDCGVITDSKWDWATDTVCPCFEREGSE